MITDRCLLVAEIGINHNGDMDLAEVMIRAAVQSGADAVKFQNYRTEDFLSDHDLKYTYRNQGVTVTESQFAMFKRCELSTADLRRLKRCCDAEGVGFLSTPTGKEGVDVLVELGTMGIKNGSDFLGNLDLIAHMARTGLPVILSTGMATEDEIAAAVGAFRAAGGRDSHLALLTCTSSYPTAAEAVHLRRMPEMARRFGVRTGFSDHTAGWEAAVAAACLGACMIEKHFTSDRGLPGPDQWFSSDPAEFRELSRRVREAEMILGQARLGPTAAEQAAREQYRLGCVAARPLPAGTILTRDDVVFRRPAAGLPPSEVGMLLGRRLVISVEAGAPLGWGVIGEEPRS